MAKFGVTIIEEREYTFEIEAGSAQEADEIALEEDVNDATSDQYHDRRVLHSAREIAS